VYCSVYEEDFALNGVLDSKIWTREVEVGGYGNGQFEETTSTNENIFIKDGMLTLKPTLQDARLIETNNTINLTASGLCSSDLWSNCVATTNTTNGTIVNPVKSARISTKKGASIHFGRVEVVAKLPAGDWLWPAIWMLPVNETYGPWPASGEVSISSANLLLINF
jgi:beta-glucanase (GH16 family)